MNTITELEGILSDEECDQFRRTPGSFNTMIRTVFQAGMARGKEDAHKRVSKMIQDVTDQLMSAEPCKYERAKDRQACAPCGHVQNT